MPATADQTEGLKLIGDWCKWLVTIETAAIAVIGTLVKENGALKTSQLARWGCGVAVVSFVASIVVAGGIFPSIPTSVQDMEPGEKIWDRDIFFFDTPIVRMWVASYVVFGLFILGVVAFAVAVLKVVAS